ncbi:hypothetical protein Bbelb_433680 [Branchiostoma belcheri]|nr:hypothetical protein Bbelb_433680 [Branchiostoma belcheri]
MFFDRVAGGQKTLQFSTPGRLVGDDSILMLDISQPQGTTGLTTGNTRLCSREPRPATPSVGSPSVQTTRSINPTLGRNPHTGLAVSKYGRPSCRPARPLARAGREHAPRTIYRHLHVRRTNASS